MKKSVIVAAASLGVVLVGVGIFFGVRSSNKKPINVISVENFGGWYGDNNSMSAMITSDVAQNVYVTQNQKIKEVYVQEGQPVKIGDPLISYDMSLANLNLEIEEMKQEGIRLRIQKAEEDLKLLKAGKVPKQTGIGGNMGGGGVSFYDFTGESGVELLTATVDGEARTLTENTTDPAAEVTETPTPTAEPTGTPEPTEAPEPTGTPEPTATPTPTATPEPTPTVEPGKPADGGPEYKERVYQQLGHDSWPISGKGTEKEPYIFVCVDKNAAVTGAFLDKMAGYPVSLDGSKPDKEKDEAGNEIKGYHFRIEVRENNKYNGKTVRAWIGNGEKLEWMNPANVLILDDQESLEKLNQGLRPEVNADILVAALEAALAIDLNTYKQGEEMDNFLLALENAQQILQKVEKEESVLQKTIDQACQLLIETQSKLVPMESGGMDGGIIGGGPSYSKEEIAKMREDKEKELRQLNLDLRQADLNVRRLSADMKNQSINSTINGVIKVVGDPENPTSMNGEPFIQVVSSEGLYVQGNLSELMLDEVQEGQILNGFGYESGVNFQAEVREVSLYPANQNYFWGGGNSNVSYYPFIAYIADAAGLNNYEMVELNMQGGEVMDPMDPMGGNGPIVLSKMFIRSENGVDYVMKDDGNGRLVRQEVELGKIYWGESYEIRSGLTKEDKVAFPYGKDVKEGARTKVVTQEEFWGWM